MKFLVAVLLAFTLAPPSLMAADVGFVQVEGMMFDQYPALGDGLRVTRNPESKVIEFAPGERCWTVTRAERTGSSYSNMSYEAEDPRHIRNKLTGLMGYPGVSKRELDEDWLRSAKGPAADFYIQNLAAPPPDHMMQLMFAPMVLAPKPMQIFKTEWSPEALKILQTEGIEGVERDCGSHFVEAIGEENYVVYAIRVELANSAERARLEFTRLGRDNPSPTLVLDNLWRMNRRFELGGGDRAVTLDVLMVGGAAVNPSELQRTLAATGAGVTFARAGDSFVGRVQLRCSPDHLERCQSLARTILDYQFGRLNFQAERTYAPVRFRIAPVRFLQVLNKD